MSPIPSPDNAAPPSVEVLRELLRPLCAKHNIVGVEIFGSTARGDAGPGSDIDLIIELKDPNKLLNFSELLEIQQDFEAAAGVPVQILTAEDYQRIGNPFLLISIDEDRRELLRLK